LDFWEKGKVASSEQREMVVPLTLPSGGCQGVLAYRLVLGHNRNTAVVDLAVAGSELPDIRIFAKAGACDSGLHAELPHGSPIRPAL
jgi:hypothetical protein